MPVIKLSSWSTNPSAEVKGGKLMEIALPDLSVIGLGIKALFSQLNKMRNKLEKPQMKIFSITNRKNMLRRKFTFFDYYQGV